jgi:hypothetical protein
MTSTQGDQDSIAILEAQIRECYGRVVYSHKAQEKSADSCTRVLRRVKLWQVILSSIVTAGFIPVIFTDPGTMKTAAIATAFLAGTLLALNLYWKESNPGRQAQLHKDAANQLWMICESYLSLLTDLTNMFRSRSRLIAIDPTSEGFAFAVLEGPDRLIDWGTTKVSKLKRSEYLKRVDALFERYQPKGLVLESPRGKDSRRSPRVAGVIRSLELLAWR